jgi:hypothetical protein
MSKRPSKVTVTKQEPARKEGSCEHCGREWQPENYGNPRQCAFEGKEFSGSNWNCGLVGAIRGEMYDNESEAHALRVRRDDQSHAALFVAVPGEDPAGCDGYSLFGMIVANWYKDRGRTDELYWTTQFKNEPVKRTEAIQIVAHLKAQEAATWAREEAEYEARMNPQPPVAVPQPWAAFTTYEVNAAPSPAPSLGGNRAQRRAAARGKL